MTEQHVTCKKCGSISMKLLRELEPDVTGPDALAILECSECGHQDEYKITSRHERKQRRMGFHI